MGHIKLDNCCGSYCAKWLVRGTSSFGDRMDYVEDIESYTPTRNEKLELYNADIKTRRRMIEAKFWFISLKKLLKRLVENGVISQEYADHKIAAYLKQHPELEEPIEVTEEFEKVERRVLIPARQI